MKEREDANPEERNLKSEAPEPRTPKSKVPERRTVNPSVAP
jgi:hypothetical protein